MAAGHTHDRITQLCLPLVASAGLVFSRNWELTLWLSGSFLFSGLMFGPDLDIHSNQSLRWGCFKWLWQPYRRSVPHRSLFSHGPIIGTVGRVVYVLIWLGLVALIVQFFRQAVGWPTWNEQQAWKFVQQWTIAQAPKLWVVFIGLELGAMTHYLADLYSSSFKKRRKPSAAKSKKKKSSPF